MYTLAKSLHAAAVKNVKKTVLWITLACVWDLFCVLAHRLLQRRQRAQKTKNYAAFALAGSP